MASIKNLPIIEWRKYTLFFIGVVVGFLMFYLNAPIINSFSDTRRASHLDTRVQQKVKAVLFPTIKIMSWNLQGGNPANLSARTTAAISIILREAPDAVFFQELKRTSYSEYCTALYFQYGCISAQGSSQFDNFVGIFYKKSRFTILDQPTITYFGKEKIRRALVLQVYVLGPLKTKMALIVTHLDNFPHNTKLRLGQLSECFKIGKSFSQDYNVILGGDLNLEEGEDNASVPYNFVDLWKASGSPANKRYTWDIVQDEVHT